MPLICVTSSSSTVPSMHKRQTWTTDVWPCRQHRPMACSSKSTSETSKLYRLTRLMRRQIASDPELCDRRFGSTADPLGFLEALGHCLMIIANVMQHKGPPVITPAKIRQSHHVLDGMLYIYIYIYIHMDEWWDMPWYAMVSEKSFIWTFCFSPRSRARGCTGLWSKNETVLHHPGTNQKESRQSQDNQERQSSDIFWDHEWFKHLQTSSNRQPGIMLSHRLVVLPAHRGLCQDHVVRHGEVQATGGNLHGQQHPGLKKTPNSGRRNSNQVMVNWGINVGPEKPAI